MCNVRMLMENQSFANFVAQCMESIHSGMLSTTANMKLEMTSSVNMIRETSDMVLDTVKKITSNLEKCKMQNNKKAQGRNQ